MFDYLNGNGVVIDMTVIHWNFKLSALKAIIARLPIEGLTLQCGKGPTLSCEDWGAKGSK